MLNCKMLASQMKLKGLSTKDLADAQGWSLTTAYRKINGKTALTAPEIQVCRELLELDPRMADAIFFAAEMS